MQTTLFTVKLGVKVLYLFCKYFSASPLRKFFSFATLVDYLCSSFELTSNYLVSLMEIRARFHELFCIIWLQLVGTMYDYYFNYEAVFLINAFVISGHPVFIAGISFCLRPSYLSIIACQDLIALIINKKGLTNIQSSLFVVSRGHSCDSRNQ